MKVENQLLVVGCSAFGWKFPLKSFENISFVFIFSPDTVYVYLFVHVIPQETDKEVNKVCF